MINLQINRKREDLFKRQVDWEAEKMFPYEPAPLPTHEEKKEEVRLTAGVYNFIKGLLP